MKLVQACLSAREDRKSCFHQCGIPVRLVQACYVRERPVNATLTSDGAVKHVEACLSATEDRESSFHHGGGPVRLVQACLCVGKT